MHENGVSEVLLYSVQANGLNSVASLVQAIAVTRSVEENQLD